MKEKVGCLVEKAMTRETEGLWSNRRPKKWWREQEHTSHDNNPNSIQYTN